MEFGTGICLPARCSLHRSPVGQRLRLGFQGRCELPACRSAAHLGLDLRHDGRPTGARPQAARRLALPGRLLLRLRRAKPRRPGLADQKLVILESCLTHRPETVIKGQQRPQLRPDVSAPGGLLQWYRDARGDQLFARQPFDQDLTDSGPQRPRLVRARIIPPPTMIMGRSYSAIARYRSHSSLGVQRSIASHSEIPQSSDCRAGIGAIPRTLSSLFLDLRHRRRAMSNPLPPQLMTPAERLDEVARLLALGYPAAARSAPGGKKPMIRTI